METDYSRFTEKERLERICKILVRWIYRQVESERNGVIPPNPDMMYTLTEAAHKLHVSKRTLQRWIKNRVFSPNMNEAGAYTITHKEIKMLELRKINTRIQKSL